MRRPLLLDLFCGAGGAAMGYHRAGFDIEGVDVVQQPRYPFTFHWEDALAVLAESDLSRFDAIHASPPCQRYTVLGSVEDLSGYPDLVGPTRDALKATGLPYVIENVPGAPLVDPVVLCGAMFPPLRVYRHRLFESTIRLAAPQHPKHMVRVNRRGENRRAWWAQGGFITITGDVGSYMAEEAMGIDWMTGNELSQAIPPAYTEHIGRQLIKHLRAAGVSAGSAASGAPQEDVA